MASTQRPGPVDDGEPTRVAEAVKRLGLEYVVLTMVARDDLPDGGADIVARSVEAIHGDDGSVGVEVLISDLKGSAEALDRAQESLRKLAEGIQDDQAGSRPLEAEAAREDLKSSRQELERAREELQSALEQAQTGRTESLGRLP